MESSSWQSSRAVRVALLLVILAALAGLSFWGIWYPIPRALCLAIASVALLGLVGLERREPRLGAGIIVAAIIIATVSALVPPPVESRDAWQYMFYGRMVSEYHESPYTSRPLDFATDPLFPQLSSRWHKTPSVYGPVFTGVSAGITALAGESALLNRLGFQLLATLAFAAILVLAWRVTRSVPVLAFLGLNPLLIVHGVNGAHNDLLVGLGLFVGVLLVQRRSWWWAGAAFGLAAGIKLTALIGVAFVCLWVWRHRRFVKGLIVGAMTFIVLGGPYLVFGGRDALSGLNANSELMSHGSMWRLIPRVGLGEVPARVATAVGLLVVVAFGAFAVWRLGLQVTSWVPIAVYCLVAAYVLPWYILWVLPMIAVTLPAVSSRLIAAYSLAFAALYQLFWKTEYVGPAAGLRVGFGFVVPVLTIGVIIALGFALRTDARRAGLEGDDRSGVEAPVAG